MQKPKVDILFAFFAYGGNGGVAMQLPSITTWFAKRFTELNQDERVGRIAAKQYGDIPLSMERNRVVKDAKDQGFDVIVMIDSDNVPDLYLGHRPEAKSFIETSFDMLYDRMLRGIPTVVCAPYCGPPPHPVNGGEENVYVFYCVGDESEDRDPDMVGAVRFEAYSREHAAIMRGIQPCAAGPTGCIMYSTDAFDLMPIHGKSDEDILNDVAAGRLKVDRAKQLLRMESWFFYEYTDQYQTRKASTEDVTNTREIQLAGIEKHGEPVVFCNWDAWAGHYKPKCVGAPQLLRIEQVSNVFAEAVRTNVSSSEAIVNVDFGDDDFDDDPDLHCEEPGISESGKPALKKHVLQYVTSLMQKLKVNRNCVIGDPIGELSVAASDGVESTFAIGLDDNVAPEGIKKIVGLGSDFESIALKLPPQSLDAIIVRSDCTYDLHGLVRQWLTHLYKRGYMVVVSPEPVMDDEFVETHLTFDGWDTLVASTQDYAMIRVAKEEDVTAEV